MLRVLAPFLALCTLSACATTGTPELAQPSSIEAIQAARMAELLTRTADTAPERVRAAQAELAALERALTTVPQPQPEPQPMAQAALAPPPDLSGSRSLMSGVHLASYRDYANLVSGWAELQGDAPATLGTLQARISEVDLGERGVFLRLKAGPLDSAEAARRLCAELEAAGHWCAPADFDGAPIQR